MLILAAGGCHGLADKGVDLVKNDQVMIYAKFIGGDRKGIRPSNASEPHKKSLAVPPTM